MWTCCKREKLARNFALDTINFLSNKNVKTILDLWCWEWLDSLLFKKCWYDVTWVDVSWVALELFRTNMREQNIEWIELIEQDISNLNLPDRYDVIYANLSIQYFKLETMKEISKKLETYLNEWGYFILRLKSVEDEMNWKWTEIENDMYEHNWQVRHFFTEEKLRDIYSEFDVVKIYNDNESLHCQDLWEEIVSIKFIIWLFQKQ